MKKGRKRIIIIIISLVCLIGIYKFSRIGDYANLMLVAMDNGVFKNFGNYKDDYQLIVDKVIKLRDEERIFENDNYIYVDDDKMFNSATGKEIALTDVERKSLLNMQKAYVRDIFAMNEIKLYKNNYILFSTIEYPLDIVYSENGDRPDDLDKDYSLDQKYEITWLAPRWFSVEAK